MGDRKEFVTGKIDELKRQLEGGLSMQAREAIERDIKAFEDELAQIVENEVAVEQDHKERIAQSESDFDALLSKLDFGGITFRQIIGSEKDYQMISIELKKAFTAQADSFSKQITTYSEQLRAATESLKETEQLLGKEKFARVIAEQTRDNSAALLDEAKKEIEQLRDWNQELREQNEFGVKTSLQIIDTEAETKAKNEYAAQKRRELTVYNVEWVDDRKRNMHKAKLAINGEETTFPWTQKGKYFIIDESEVQQFRSEYGISLPTVEADNVDETNEAGVTPEQFQVEPPEIPAVTPIDLGMADQQQGVPDANPVTREEVRSIVQEELAKLGYVKEEAA